MEPLFLERVALGGGYIGWHKLTSHKLGNPTSPARGFTAGSAPLAEEPAEIAFRPFGTRFPLKSWWENVFGGVGGWGLSNFFWNKKGQTGLICCSKWGLLLVRSRYFLGWVGSLSSIKYDGVDPKQVTISQFLDRDSFCIFVSKTQRWDCFVMDGTFGLGCVL